MSSFRFGLWVGFVAGFVLAHLLGQGDEQRSLEEILLADKSPSVPFGKTPAPETLADALSKQNHP